jgi:CO dehydrogenase maturation factor
MRIAFVGKGGGGKTTVAAVFSRYAAERGRRVVAIDADINQHLAQALGHDGPPPRPLGGDLAWLKEHLRRDNPRIASVESVIKTTPPGRGSRMLDLDPDDAVLRRFAIRVGGVDHLATGEFDESDVGVSCFHAKTGAVELYLNHLLDGPGEYVVVDMTAGADAFASGLFTRFDLTVLVCEPTRRGVWVYRQYAELARSRDVALRVLGSKVAEPAGVDYLREQVGDALLGWLGQSSWVRAAERGATARSTPSSRPTGRSSKCCSPRWTPRYGTGPPTSAARWSSIDATQWRGPTRRSGLTWLCRSTRTSCPARWRACRDAETALVYRRWAAAVVVPD